MTPQEFQLHWAEAAPLQPASVTLVELERAQRLTHHCIEIDERLPALVLWGIAANHAVAAGLHMVACLQIRRQLARIDGEAFPEPASGRLDRATANLYPPAVQFTAWTARIEVTGPDSAVIRLLTVTAGRKEYLDVVLDCGLSQTLGQITWGKGWFARTLGIFDQHVE